MRIVHVTDSYLPRVGGIEMHVRDLALRQRAQGDDPMVLTCGPGPADGTVPVRGFPGVRGLLLPQHYPELRRILTSPDVGVVHAHLSLISPLAWAALHEAVRAGVPAVATMHSMVPSRGRLTSLLRRLDSGPGPRITWTAVSEAAASPLRQALGDRPVLVLPNGIEPDDWSTAVHQPAGDRPLTVVSVLRMSRRKRPVPLVRALAAVRELVPPDQRLRAVLVGAGPQTRAVLSEARRLRVDGWVEVDGQLSRPQIRNLLAGADLYLAPARAESFGLAALEARCAGVPVVAMSCGGVDEFIRHGVNGALVRDDDDLARTAAGLLGDPALLRRMAEHNRSTTPPTTWERVLPMNAAAYVAAGAPQGRPAVAGGAAG
jgi:phosphatidylinositol alpha 1,6-mannosyltransferase